MPNKFKILGTRISFLENNIFIKYVKIFNYYSNLKKLNSRGMSLNYFTDQKSKKIIAKK